MPRTNKKARAPRAKVRAPNTKARTPKTMARAPRAKVKPLVSAPSDHDRTKRVTTLDLTDTPEFLAAFGIEPRLYEGVEPIILSFGPKELLEARGDTIVERPDRSRSAEALFFEMIARAREIPRRRRATTSTKPPPKRRAHTAK